jgi:hypothetical protein
LDIDDKPRMTALHLCTACKEPLHSAVMCDQVWEPHKSGFKTFCGKQCVEQHNTKLARDHTDDEMTVDLMPVRRREADAVPASASLNARVEVLREGFLQSCSRCVKITKQGIGSSAGCWEHKLGPTVGCMPPPTSSPGQTRAMQQAAVQRPVVGRPIISPVSVEAERPTPSNVEQQPSIRPINLPRHTTPTEPSSLPANGGSEHRQQIRATSRGRPRGRGRGRGAAGQ